MASMASRPVAAQVTQNFSFPNVTDAQSAQGVSKVIANETMRATDSRRTSAQNLATVDDYGRKKR
jgi:hypothetical protein